MNELKLKDGIAVEYDEKSYSYLFPNADVSKFKKVTSRTFPSLVGENKWESIGSTILKCFKMREEEDIDPFYTLRGEIGEQIVFEFLKKHYKESKGIDITLKTWDKNIIKYDNFSRNDKFGGLIDIAIVNPAELMAVVEVKSKSLKDFDKIKELRGNIEEVMQGQFLTLLSNVTKCLMVYIFFTPEQEIIVKEYMASQESIGYIFNQNDVKIWARKLIEQTMFKPESFKISVFKYDISDKSIKSNLDTKMVTAHNNLLIFQREKKIAQTYFTAQENAYLQKKANTNKPDLFGE